MGLFKKRGQPEKTMPTLPELPQLPELPGFNSENSQLPKLPSFPNNSLGDKFSQNTIKEAVAGKKEGEVEADDFQLPDFDEDEMMQEPLSKPKTKTIDEYEEEIEEEEMPKRKSYEMPVRSGNYTATRKAEPIFVRLDKFEESLNIFEKAKEQIGEIEHALRNIKALKEKEEEELNSWEKEIQEIKNQIEKVDQEIFSKVE